MSEALRGAALHEEHGGGAVGDLGGVAGVDGAVFGKGRADLAERFGGDALADAVVFADGDGLLLVGLGVCPLDGQGSEFLVEETLVLGLDGFLERRGGEGVLLAAGNIFGLGHLLGEDAHGDFAVCRLLLRLEEFAELADGSRAVLCGHALSTGTDADLDHAGPDGVGNVNAGLQTRRALSVQRLARCCDREAGSKSSSAELGSATAWCKDGTDSDIFNELGVDLGAFEERLECAVEEVGCLGIFEATLSTLGEGCAESACYDDLIATLVSCLLVLSR